jgi:hypothetical protein
MVDMAGDGEHRLLVADASKKLVVYKASGCEVPLPCCTERDNWYQEALGRERPASLVDSGREGQDDLAGVVSHRRLMSG